MNPITTIILTLVFILGTSALGAFLLMLAYDALPVEEHDGEKWVKKQTSNERD